MPVDALLERILLEDGVNVELERLLDQTFNGDDPGPRFEVFGEENRRVIHVLPRVLPRQALHP